MAQVLVRKLEEARHDQRLGGRVRVEVPEGDHPHPQRVDGPAARADMPGEVLVERQRV
jgi:hypothetical protein